MGLIEDTFLGIAGDAAEGVAGEHARRAVPAGAGRAVLLLVVLLVWILAAGLVVTGLVWMASGAFPQGLGAVSIGAALAWLLTRASRMRRRG